MVQRCRSCSRKRSSPCFVDDPPLYPACANMCPCHCYRPCPAQYQCCYQEPCAPCALKCETPPPPPEIHPEPSAPKHEKVTKPPVCCNSDCTKMEFCKPEIFNHEFFKSTFKNDSCKLDCSKPEAPPVKPTK